MKGCRGADYTTRDPFQTEDGSWTFFPITQAGGFWVERFYGV